MDVHMRYADVHKPTRTLSNEIYASLDPWAIMDVEMIISDLGWIYRLIRGVVYNFSTSQNC